MADDSHPLHGRLRIADAHADSLMWNRDLNVRSEEGHVDFPRLREGGVKLQCFTIVTRGFPFIGGFPIFAAYKGWPKAARKSEWTRTVWQTEQLERFCAASGGAALIARTSADLEPGVPGEPVRAVLGIEGAHALEGEVARISELWRRGVRFMGLTHLANNALGGSSFPLMGNRPLSMLGHEVLDAMVARGMSVDVAHAAPATLAGIFAHAKARPFCSHTGVAGAARSWRNLSDEALRALADRGGVAGIIFATPYLGGSRLRDVVRHIEHALSVMGEDSVGLGSDFDGMIPLPRGMRDARDLHLLTEALRQRGFSERIVEKVMGENLFRFFRETLPQRP